MKKWISYLFCVCACIPAFSQSVLYVNEAATGQNNGQSWPNAFKKIQDALKIADYGTEIRVAKGVYKPDEHRDSSFELKNGIKLRGGYAGSGANPDQRNIAVNETILNGDIGKQGDSTDNCYNVISATNFLDHSTELEGFIIERGCANALLTPGQLHGERGGGLYMLAEGSLQINYCTFRRNFATKPGSAIFFYGDGTRNNIRLQNCIFTNSTGIAVTLTPNFADSTVIRDCKFYNNSVSPDCLKIFVSGAGEQSPRTIIIEKCVFEQNIAKAEDRSLVVVESPGSNLLFRSNKLMNNRFFEQAGLVFFIKTI
jgi:Right handed beta helix region